ncbi:Protein PIN-LIKES 5 [Dichanthelium oligosanthes]|uniref:Protein PIN-LIKES 5 n=1 Tax=Dichanthelium oligosanthes TaxID=888268 RepID=A0A1E5VF72_9POAL|nr:Protein PIN-LIKES 5 [Dichanthelium oligosanthes]
MKFWSLLIVAWLPVLQVLLVGLLGALLASNRFNVLTSDARRNINKIVYIVFVPSLVFSSLASTVTLEDIISCYSVMKRSANLYKAKCKNHAQTDTSKEHSGQDASGDYVAFLPVTSENCSDNVASNSISSPLPPNDLRARLSYCLRRAEDMLVALKELWSPPSVAALLGFTVGAIHKVKSLVTEEGSPLQIFLKKIKAANLLDDNFKLWSRDATIPCTVLILGGNLTKGIGRSRTVIKPIVVISIIAIRFFLLPACGIGIVTAATKLGFLPRSPLYHYVLLLQSTVPPAMSIGTIAQLFDVGEEECSIIFLWTHLVAALALTLWSTVFMSLVL